MASVPPTTFQKEVTFTSYNQEQGKIYAQARRDYDPSVYKNVIEYHDSTGGKFDSLLDVGCGPGLATRHLATHFAHATGIDPSEGMLSNARALGGRTSSSEPIRFECSPAEALGSDLTPSISASSIDLITAANAAHWFDLNEFWASAARVLKPGGTVALWASGPVVAHPSLPNAQAISEAAERHYLQYLTRYETPGNILTRNRYRDLSLPWTLERPVPDFDQSSFVRKEWAPGERFFSGPEEIPLDTYEKMMGTASAVTRWREAHPDLAGTEEDVIRILRRQIGRLLQEAGAPMIVKGDVQGVLLMVKKRR